MKPLRIHLDTIAIIVLVATLDLGWYVEYVRHGYNHPSAFGFSDRGFDGSVLPMLSLLVVGLHHILFHRERPPFLVGFVLAGLAASLAFMAWVWIAPDTVAESLTIRPFPGLVRALRWGRISLEQFIWSSCIIDGTLQLSLALLGGWLANWIAVRRGSPLPVSDPRVRATPPRR